MLEAGQRAQEMRRTELWQETGSSAQEMRSYSERQQRTCACAHTHTVTLTNIFKSKKLLVAIIVYELFTPETAQTTQKVTPRKQQPESLAKRHSDRQTVDCSNLVIQCNSCADISAEVPHI